MNYQFSVLEKKEYNLLDNLADRVSLDEEIDHEAIFIVSKQSNHLLGAVGFKMITNNGIPRLEHIIVDIPYQKTRLGVLLLKEMEKYLSDSYCNEYYSYILNSNHKMIGYGIKWGMKLKTVGEKGSWYHKELRREYDKIMALCQTA